MKKIGITGGIGSGKTMVCNVFAALGIPVYNADAVARHLMKSDDFIRQSLKDLLGNEVYKGTEPDRDRIATLVFKDPGLLAKVNRIVHPRVADHFFGMVRETNPCSLYRS
jgi:dephospho-CoA kinase